MRNGNLLLALLIEIVMLVAFCVAGWSVAGPLWLRIVLAVGLPALAIVAWALWAAPRAGARRLKMPALLYFKAVIYALAVLAWFVAGQGFIGTVFAVLAAINLVAAVAYKQV
jgi:hypothetical protein